MAQLYSNNAQSTLSASSTSTDTTLFIQPGHGARFPVISGADFFYVTLENAVGNIEICRVTAHSSNSTSMTVQRAQQGTTALAWASGDLIELRATAAELTGFETDIDALDATRARFAGQTYSGTHDFRSATVQVATRAAGDSTNAPASTAFVTAQVFSTSLPGQVGNAGKILQTDGTNASWVSKDIKEDVIAPGNTSQFWRGDKTWADFSTYVRTAVLTGFSTALDVAVQATDSVVVAMGKLQGQISGVLSTLTNHTSSTGNVHGLTTQQIGLTSMSQNADASTIAQRNASGQIYTTHLNSTDNSVSTGVTGVLVKAGDNFHRTSTAAGLKTFLGYSGNEISANRNNSATDIGTAQEIRWKNYGSGHTIFDASASTSPNGVTINNTNSQSVWVPSHPTLMGWNGTQTYGVRVDTARFAETTTAATINRVTTNTSTTSLGSISVAGSTNGFAGAGIADTNSGFLVEVSSGLSGYIFNGVWRWYCDTSNNLYAYGNVTAYSDERLKTNWRGIDQDFIKKWADVKHGIYDRTDNNQTQVGLSAQSVQDVLPHAVIADKDGFLSLNYGAAAAVATVQLAKKIMELTARIEALEAAK